MTDRIDPKTGIKPIADWGPSCGRGFVCDSRFGGGQVIKRTSGKRTGASVSDGYDRQQARKEQG